MCDNDVELLHTLSSLRQKIDGLDTQILQLLAQRSECVNDISKTKYHFHMDIIDEGRESMIIRRVSTNNPSRYHSKDLERIFRAILQAGVNLQLLKRSRSVQ